MSFSEVKPGGWTTGDSLLAGQLNSMQSNMVNSFDISSAGATALGPNTFSGVNSFTGGLNITCTGGKQVIMDSYTSLSGIRGISSPTDGQIVQLSDTSRAYYPNNVQIVYRYDASDGYTKDGYKATGSDSKWSYYAIKPTGVSNTQNGVWKPINNSGFAKHAKWLQLISSATGNSLGTSGIPLPSIASWTSSVTNGSWTTDYLGFSNASILTTDPAAATSNGWTCIPKAESYYDVEISLVMTYTWGSTFSAWYTTPGGCTLLGALTCANFGTSSFTPGETSTLTNLQPSWDTVMEASTTSANYNGTRWHYRKLTEKLRIPAASLQADQLEFYLSLAGIDGSLWAGFLGSGTNAPILTIKVTAY
jgi:hypothetical protein